MTNEIAPGWYPDGDVMRRWDGLEWTAETRPRVAEPTPAPAAVEESSSALVPLGYIFAVLVPFAGFIIGLVALRKSGRTRKHAPWIIAISVAVFIIALVLILNAQHTAAMCTYGLDANGNTICQ